MRGYFAAALIVWMASVGLGELKGSRLIFEFDSGGANHPEGYGAWKVRVDGGHAEFEHRVRGHVARYRPVTLPETEREKLWKLVNGAGLDKRPDSKQNGPPDEPRMTFIIKRGADTRTVTIQLDSRQSDDPVLRLLQNVSELIEKYTGQRPVLF